MRQLFRLSLSLLAITAPLVCTGQSGLGKELFQAVARGDMGAVRVLLDNGASIDARNESGDTPVMVAAANHNIAMTKLLLEKGADISVRNNHEETALTEAARSFDPEMLQTLLDANPDIKDKNAALLQAAEGGPVVIQMVDSPLTANRQEEQAATAPQELPWVKNVRLLLDSGANIETRDEKGSTPLMRAASFAQTETFNLLIARGAKINVRDKQGMTPLIAAACACAVATMNSTYDIMKILLEKGVTVNARDHDGRTALMMAAGSPDDAASVKLLLNHGADPLVRDAHGKTALDFADGNPFPEKVRLLKRAMASIH